MLYRTILIAGLASLAAANADATTLLDLVDAPDQVETPYSFDITASSSSLTISFAGYQLPGAALVNYISLTNAAGANLLDQSWTFAPAPTGSWADQVNYGPSVNAILFYAMDVGSYDTFSQTISAVAGTTYTLAFLYSNDGSPDAFRVATNGDLATSSVPEPASWALMIGGFGIVGSVLRRRYLMNISFA
jgi:hypothetical protein